MRPHCYRAPLTFIVMNSLEAAAGDLNPQGRLMRSVELRWWSSSADCYRGHGGIGRSFYAPNTTFEGVETSYVTVAVRSISVDVHDKKRQESVAMNVSATRTQGYTASDDGLSRITQATQLVAGLRRADPIAALWTWIKDARGW